MENKRYNIIEGEQIIMGEPHILIERNDGFRFYLDQAFLAVLKQQDRGQVSSEFEELGVESHEIPIIVRMLKSAGLI
jgi:hypothetical protein